MKRLAPLLLPILLSASLLGCASPYVQPTTGPRAKILFINDAQRTLNISYFNESAMCIGRRKTEAILPTTEKEHVVQAGREITFEYYLTNFGDNNNERSCLLNLRFNPKADGSYVFRTSENAYSCRWIMTDVSDSNNPKPQQLKVVRWSSGFIEDSSFCNE